jgi:hypothetical protein
MNLFSILKNTPIVQVQYPTVVSNEKHYFLFVSISKTKKVKKSLRNAEQILTTKIVISEDEEYK